MTEDVIELPPSMVDGLIRTVSTFDANMVEQYKEVFNMFDADHSGGITKEEFNNAFKRYSMIADRDELMKIIGEVDTDGDGEIEWEEFLNIMNDDLTLLLSDHDIQIAFDEADRDGDGLINAEDIHRFMVYGLNDDITLEDAETMMFTADTQHRGKIDFKEFKEMILNAH